MSFPIPIDVWILVVDQVWSRVVVDHAVARAIVWFEWCFSWRSSAKDATIKRAEWRDQLHVDKRRTTRDDVERNE